MTNRITRTVTCDACGKTFDSQWSEEERDTEAVKNFGESIQSRRCSTLCNECYERLMDRLRN